MATDKVLRMEVERIWENNRVMHHRAPDGRAEARRRSVRLTRPNDGARSGSRPTGRLRIQRTETPGGGSVHNRDVKLGFFPHHSGNAVCALPLPYPLGAETTPSVVSDNSSA